MMSSVRIEIVIAGEGCVQGQSAPFCKPRPEHATARFPGQSRVASGPVTIDHLIRRGGTRYRTPKRHTSDPARVGTRLLIH